jgi:glycine/D-amino acid oxidase-like deaminating enzyme
VRTGKRFIEARHASKGTELRGGLPTMTADGAHTVGPVPGVRGLYVAGGCCVGGLSIAPAIRGSAGSVDY